MSNAYTDYYKELCPSEESWVHRQLSNEREKLEDEISKLRAELEVANHSIVSSLLYNTLKETCDQLRAEVAEWQRANLELHHAIQPTDGETLLGAAQTLRNEIDALNESILVQQIFSDDRIRANEAEADLKASRYETVKAAQDGLRECIRAERAEAERDQLRTEVERLRFAMSKSCDDEREMSISEGPGHSTCGLADELTARAERAEAELAAERKAKRDLAEVISGQDKELAKERARLRIVEEFMLRRHIPQAEDDYPQIWLGNGYFDTLADAADAAMQTNIK